MIQLRGHKERWFTGAGALGLDGFDAGHPPLVRAYKMPFRAAGLLDPHAFTVITKTVTSEPRAGRQTDWGFRKYCWPVFPLSWRSMVNAVALTNPGIDHWIRVHYRHAIRKKIKLVLSLHVHDAANAVALAKKVQPLRDLAGVQINAGCPNLDPAHSDPDAEVAGFTKIVDAFQGVYTGPLLIKFRLGQPWERMAEALEGRCAAYELVNACPWDHAKTLCLTPQQSLAGKGMVDGVSPLAKYGVGGSVSGGRLAYSATIAMGRYKTAGGLTPVVSGGGVVGHYDPNGYPKSWQPLESEVRLRFYEGADAVAFSTAFLWEPWAPNRAVKTFDRMFREDGDWGERMARIAAHFRKKQEWKWPPSRRKAELHGGCNYQMDGDFPTFDHGAGSLD